MSDTATLDGLGDGPGAGAAAGEARSWRVRDRSEWRQVGIIAAYVGIMAAMFLVPAWRMPWMIRPGMAPT